jgi:glycosyltransferase involved in cell wall biosynthesis
MPDGAKIGFSVYLEIKFYLKSAFKMKIIYDAHIYLEQKAGGISRYHYELFKGMCRLGHDARIAGLFVKNQYLLSDNQYGKPFISNSTASFAAFNKWILKRKLRKMDPDGIFHPANPYKYLYPEICGIKNKVFTIHDMIVEKQDVNANAEKLFYALNASKIIAVSGATRQDIVKLWGIDKEKIEVIYHGSSLNPSMAKKTAKPVPENFLLYVGDRGGHKNFITFIRAAAVLLKKHKKLCLVCAGKRAFSQEETHLIKRLEIEKKVLFFVRPNDSELTYLYSKADAFVFPSLNEGFGIPVLEAWACKTPVILSNNPCFNEIAAEAGYYFIPDSQESILESIEKVLMDKVLQKDLIKKGTNRLSLFSWEKTVKQTSELYKSLL